MFADAPQQPIGMPMSTPAMGMPAAASAPGMFNPATGMPVGGGVPPWMMQGQRMPTR